jgi:hypothetical protein
LATVYLLCGLFLHLIELSPMCKCGANPPFMRAAKQCPVIVVGEVQLYGPANSVSGVIDDAYMIVDVKKVLKGNESRTKIKVWGWYGKACYQDVSTFPLHSTWVFALLEEDNEERANDYYLSRCGQFWLSVKDKNAQGIVYEENKKITIPLDKLSREF